MRLRQGRSGRVKKFKVCTGKNSFTEVFAETWEINNEKHNDILTFYAGKTRYTRKVAVFTMNNICGFWEV